MGFESLQQFTPKSTIGRVRSAGDKVGFSTDLASKTKSGEDRFGMRILIPEPAVTQMRLLSGDMVDVQLDKEKRLILVKRITNGKGWKLTSNTSNGSLNLKVTWRPGMPSVASTVHCNYIIDDRGLVFELPQEVSFEECARKANSNGQ